MIGSHILLITVSIVLGGALLIGTLLLYFAVRNAVDGSEDDNGFHHQ